MAIHRSFPVRYAYATTAVVFTLVCAAGCSTHSVNDAHNSEDTDNTNNSDSATSSASETSVVLTPVADLAVGDCIVDRDAVANPSNAEDKGALALEYEVVDCTEAHNAEIYGITELQYGSYPGQEYTQSDANKFCLPEFRKYHGDKGDEKGLSLSYLTPTKESWEENNDRTVVCVVTSPEKDLNSSLKESGA